MTTHDSPAQVATPRPLTERQSNILRYLIDYTKTNGVSPLIREIQSKFGITTKRGVTTHLDALERKGYVKRTSLPRSTRVLRGVDGREVLCG